jgi:hypothetical protein
MTRSRERRPASFRFPLEDWHFSKWQKAVWNATSSLSRPRFIFLNAGRGAGKDIIAIRCCLRDALKWYELQRRRIYAGEQKNALNPICKVWVTAPQENNIKQAWEDWKGELRHLAACWGPSIGIDANESDWLFREVVRENKIIVFGRGELEIEKRLTSTRDALRGPGVDLLHWTEFAMETIPGELERAFRGELPGTLTRAGRLGRVYATTTPKGPMGGFYDEMVARFGEGVVQAITDGECTSADGLSYYRHATSYANEFLTREQIQQIEAEKVNGWLYEQERLARFVVGDLGGEKAFRRDWVEKCLVGTREKREGFRQIIVGVDIARFGDDETCYLALDDESGDVLRVEFHKGRSGAEIVDDLKRLSTEFPGAQFFVDSTGHRGYIADFAPSWLPITETQFSREKEKWVGGLRMLLQLGRLRIPNPDSCAGLVGAEKEALRKLLKQMLQFVKIVKQTGGIDFRHPPGEHDDGVDALMLASMRLATRMQETLGAAGTKKALGRLVI